MGTRVCQVSYSQIDTDPRLLRTISTLQTNGYEISKVGYGHGLAQPKFNLGAKIATALSQLPARLVPSSAQLMYWAQSQNRRTYELICCAKPDIIHAHDWPVLPAAVRAAATLGAKLIYDSHEFGREQLLHKKLWREVYPAYISALENVGINKADAVITISEGCGQLLRKATGLQQHPTIIRNTPPLQTQAFKPVNANEILVQFQGHFTPGRGMSNLIRSVAFWPDRFRLRMTGLPLGRVDIYFAHFSAATRFKKPA